MAALEGKLREMSLAERMHAERPQRAPRNPQLGNQTEIEMTDIVKTDRLLAAFRRGEYDLDAIREIFLAETGDARAAKAMMDEFIIAADIDPRQGL